MAKQKLEFKKGTTREDVLDAIDTSVIEYMRGKRGLDEAGMRKLLNEDKDVMGSYTRKIERAVKCFIADGIPSKFFGK